LSSIIEELNKFDKNLCKTISSKVEVDTILEDVEKGSIRIILANILRSIDDEGLAACDVKKIFGKYLTDARYLMLKFLDDNKSDINNSSKLIQLQNDIFELSNTDKNIVLPVFNKISTNDLLENIDGINKAASNLCSTDKMRFNFDNKTVSAEFNEKFSLETFEDILTANNFVTENEMILKVKKPDYLGDSKWEFRHGKNSIPAKITDIEWLKKFQNREIDIRPKDAIKCKVKITTKYDSDNEPITTIYEINKVIEVINDTVFVQENMFDR
jgi:hypothetical protein